MSHSVKRNLSILGIIIASVAAGMILTANLGWTRKSAAQQSQTIHTPQGPITSVTVPSFADLAARVMPSVVSITTEEVVRNDARSRGVDPFDFFFPDPRRQRGQEDDEQKRVSGGSGFIISEDGYILTNNHVVEGASKVTVRYGTDDRTTTAKVVGTDPATDLALLKIDVNEPLPTLRLGDSDRIRVGDWAVAIGNPLQFENTLTVGVISGVGRQNLGISETTASFENFIQTDAAINLGNSGGPLLNINGEVVGINTAMRAYAQNIGFATPVNIAKKIYPQLKAKGKVVRGYLGIRIGEVDERTRDAFELPNRDGALVQQVEENEPAERAGIQAGDLIIQVDNQAVRKTRDLIDYVSDQTPGTPVKITLIRDGQRKTLTAKVGERPVVGGADDQAPVDDNEARSPGRLGISVQEITPSARQTYGLDDRVRGIVVTNVKGVSPAADAGIVPGDVISEVNGARITTVEQFGKIVEQSKTGQYLRIYISRSARGGRPASFFAIVQVP